MTVQTQVNMTAINAFVKEFYDGQALVDLTYKNHPFWALLEKKTNFGGRNYPLPVLLSPAAGISNTFSNAQANIAAPTSAEFLLTRVKKYGTAQIDREAMLAAQTDKETFKNALDVTVQTAVQGVMGSLCADLFGDGTGKIGTISGSVSSGVITLSNPGDVVNFEVNSKINAVTSGSPRAAAGFVIKVNRSITAATVTVSTTLGGSAGTPSGWGDTDTLCRDGDNALAISGIQAWIPASDPSNTTFFSVDRTSDVVRLGGVRVDGSNQSIEEALIDGASTLNREGGNPDVCVMGPDSFKNLAKSLSTRLVYGEAEHADFSFRYIDLNTPSGPVKVFQDMNAPPKAAFLLEMDSWCFYSRGEAPHIVSENGGDMLRVYNADAYELRVAMYGQLGCKAPGHNANIKLAA